jgi:drug/metabolite transporter (DMT)-like permease
VTNRSKSIRWSVLLVGLMLIWGLMYPATKYVVQVIDPGFVAFMRYCIATLALLPFYVVERRKSDSRIGRRDAIAMSALGLLGVAGFSVCITFGIKLSTAANSALLVNTQPILTALIAPLLIREGTSPLRIVGGVFGLVGIYLLVSGGMGFSQLLRPEYLLGNMLLLSAALLFSLYSIFIKRYVSAYGGLVPTFLSMAAGTVLLTPVLILGTGASLHSITLVHGALLLYIGVVATAVAYLLLNQSYHHLGVVRAVGFKFLIPVFGFVLSVILLSENPTVMDYIGAGIVIVAVLLIQNAAVRRTN